MTTTDQRKIQVWAWQVSTRDIDNRLNQLAEIPIKSREQLIERNILDRELVRRKWF